MKCKTCHNTIPDNSIFCLYCGERVVKPKKAKSTEIKVPKPVQLSSGTWRIWLAAEKQSVTESTAELCITKARAVRAGFLASKKQQPKKTLYDAIGEYIAAKDAVLSPSTIYGYKKIQRIYFKALQQADFFSIDWQKAINAESRIYSPKSISNAWGLVASVIRYNGNQPPAIKLPAKEKKELPWLSYEQIGVFLQAIHGQPCEFAALLALHSLRRSELLAITPRKIDAQGIHVDGAMVYADGHLVSKSTNKTSASKRVVPIMIPRLQELIDASTNKPDEPYVSTNSQVVYDQITRICQKNDLPKVGFHGLRRTFASLAYHLGLTERQAMAIGGWDDLTTMHKIYIKLDSTDIDSAAEYMRFFYINSCKNPCKK